MSEHKRKALMAVGNYWTSPFQVGSHHIARSLVKNGFEVAFISDPISPFHRLAGINEDYKRRFDLHRTGGIWDLDHRVWGYVPYTIFSPHNKPFLSTKCVADNWHKLTMPNIINLVKKTGFNNVDLLYLDSPAQAFWVDKIKHKKAIFRIADRNDGFGKHTKAIYRLEKKLARQVDTVVYTATTLEDYVKNLNPKSMFYLPNGVNFGHFANKKLPIPLDMQDIPKPIAIYVGAMDVWFDYNLVNQAAKNLPHISFVLIGPEKLAREKVTQLPNIHLLGAKKYTDIPAYIQNADVGIIPFDVEGHSKLVNSIHPLKLYEYMACGLPVLARRWQELERLRSPAILYDSLNEFVSILDEICNKEFDKSVFIQYASNQDWGWRVDDLLKMLGGINR